MKGRIWVRSEKQHEDQDRFGQTISICVTDADNSQIILAEYGPYTIPVEGMISHKLLVGDFNA